MNLFKLQKALYLVLHNKEVRELVKRGDSGIKQSLSLTNEEYAELETLVIKSGDVLQRFSTTLKKKVNDKIATCFPIISEAIGDDLLAEFLSEIIIEPNSTFVGRISDFAKSLIVFLTARNLYTPLFSDLILFEEAKAIAGEGTIPAEFVLGNVKENTKLILNPSARVIELGFHPKELQNYKHVLWELSNTKGNNNFNVIFFKKPSLLFKVEVAVINEVTTKLICELREEKYLSELLNLINDHYKLKLNVKEFILQIQKLVNAGIIGLQNK